MPQKRIRKNPRHQTKTPGNGKAGDSEVFGPDRQLSSRFRMGAHTYSRVPVPKGTSQGIEFWLLHVSGGKLIAIMIGLE
ncbi:hypothetical protein N8612_01725 [Verrucomicrobia bacterium]|nr:hypothetical protein [Verrucomicrobiota bacterium]